MPLAEKAEAKQVEKNITKFRDFCRSHLIKNTVHKDYFDFAEPVSKIPSHRMLAIMRGFMEGFLRMNIAPEEEAALLKMEKQFITANNDAAEQVKQMRDLA